MNAPESYFVNYSDTIADPTLEWGWSDDNRADLAALADAIKDGISVLYLGAGASIAAGLSGWGDMCRLLCEWTLQDPEWPEAERTFLTRLLHTESFPLLAQIIENKYRENNAVLYVKLRELCSCADKKPSEVHLATAMLPIPLRITTNYEDLLEQAIRELPNAFEMYSFQGLPLTWLDGAGLLGLVRSRKPGVIKMHGDFAWQESIVLTSNHYRRISHDTAFASVLRALIATHSFLFVGCSLRDRDLFALLDEVIENFRLLKNSGAATPPMHYALLPLGEANSAFVSHLRRNYGIATLPVPNGKDGKPILPAVLRFISSEVARRMRFSQVSGLGDWPRVQSAEAYLGEIIRMTGSHRGDVVFADDDKTHQLKWWLEWEQNTTKETAKWHQRPPAPTGVISAAFAERVDLLYVKDTKVRAESGVPYRQKDSGVRSELVVPIHAQGYRVGVLNVESYLPDAYYSGHVHFLQQQAQLIGQIYLDAEMRNQRIASLGLSDDQTNFIIGELQQLYPGAEQLRGVIYKADYKKLTLEGFYRNQDTITPLKHRFNDNPSFAAGVFRNENAADYLADVENQPVISQENAAKVGLKKGPLFGTQLFDKGLPCAVLVLWGNQDGGENAFEHCGLRDPRKVSLLGITPNFILSNYQPGVERPRDVLRKMRLIGGSHVQEVYARTADAVSALGLKRLRIWRLIPEKEYAEVVFASPESHRAVIGAQETWVSQSSDVTYSAYSALVRGRYQTDPWARAQGPQMFNLGPDPSAGRLQKDGDASWLVAPMVGYSGRAGGDHNAIGKEQELIGYLAADNDEDKYFEDEKERNWLQCGLSVISVLTTMALSALASTDTAAGSAHA